MSKIVNIPELRFKEFSGEWEKDILKNIFKISSDKFNPINSEKQYKCIELEHLAQNTGKLLGYIGSYNQASIKNKFNKNDILFGKLRPYLKKYWLAQFDGVCSSEIWVLNGKKVTNNFLFYLIQTDKFNLISNISSGSKMPRADWKYMAEVPFFIPQKPEQQKIASFLTTIDTKIEQLTKKVELQEQYKKGVMQKIFNQEIRFKRDDGSEFDEWEEKRLGDIGDTYNGLTGKIKEDFGNGKPYIQYKQIFDSNIIDIKQFGFVHILKNENQNKVQYGDVFFTTSSETPNEIGFSSVLMNNISELYLNSFCFGYRPNSIKVLFPLFSVYLFRSIDFRRKIIKLAQGSTRYNMSKIELMKIKIDLPSPPEQTKIANFFSTLDKQIGSTKKQLAKTKEFKKGLLQRMFV